MNSTQTALTFTKHPEYDRWTCDQVPRITIVRNVTTFGGGGVSFYAKDGDYFLRASRTLLGAKRRATNIAREYLADAARNELAAALVSQL